jgi:hypothetical protein
MNALRNAGNLPITRRANTQECPFIISHKRGIVSKTVAKGERNRQHPLSDRNFGKYMVHKFPVLLENQFGKWDGPFAGTRYRTKEMAGLCAN